jgi:hypothetical protein
MRNRNLTEVVFERTESLVWDETGVKAEIFMFFLIYHFMALTWHSNRKRIQFATLGANDAAIKHHCKMKVNPKSNLISSIFSSFYAFIFLSFCSAFALVCEWREF